MNRPRYQLLPGPVLSRYQNTCLGRRYLLDALEYLAEWVGVADDFISALNLIPEVRHAGREPPQLQGTAEGHEESIRVERLFQEVVRSLARGLDRGVDRTVSRDHHDERARIVFPKSRQHIQAVESWHLHVEEDHVRHEFHRQSDTLPPVLGLAHLMALVLEELREGATDPALVVDHQKSCHSQGPPLASAACSRMGWVPA